MMLTSSAYKSLTNLTVSARPLSKSLLISWGTWTSPFKILMRGYDPGPWFLERRISMTPSCPPFSTNNFASS